MSTEYECRAAVPCGHQIDEHGPHGCADGCGCTWVPQRVIEPVLGGEPPFAAASGPTNPAAAVEVRDRCPHCGDHQLVPRRLMAEHMAEEHGLWCKFDDGCHRVVPCEPGCAATSAAMYAQLAAASGVQPDTRPAEALASVCPTLETHNWGCGCPSDVAAAVASCPGRELDGPSPCRCPCEGCAHNCAAHQPPARPVPDTERRERYAGMLYELMNPGFRWVDLPADAPDRGAYLADAGDPMAVADEEQQGLRGEIDARRIELLRVNERHGEENERLRAELGKARATVLREQADFYDGVLRDWPNPDSDPRYCTAIHDVVLGLRRLAAETAAGSGGQAEAPYPTSITWTVEARKPGEAVWFEVGDHYTSERAHQQADQRRKTTPDDLARVVRQVVTTTVEPEQADEDGAQQK